MTTWSQQVPDSATWTQAGFVQYILSEIFDFLMTEDDCFLITEASINSIWSQSLATASSWSKQVPS